MTYVVELSEPAERDISEAIIYTSQNLHNPIAAEKLLKKLESAFFLLSDLPQRHEIVLHDSLISQGIRFRSVSNYLLFYVIREQSQKVVILRCLHTRREWLTLLQEINEVDI